MSSSRPLTADSGVTAGPVVTAGPAVTADPAVGPSLRAAVGPPSAEAVPELPGEHPRTEPGPDSEPTRRRARLVRAASSGAALELDASQRAVADRGAGSGPLVVTGAPGTGKTTVVVESAVVRVRRDGLDPSALLVLAPTRRAAAALRDRISLRLGAGGAAAMREPVARTPASFAFDLIRRHARRTGQPVPRLISGPEQDDILRDLLAGHAAGDGVLPPWPPELQEALQLNGFRHELRDLLMRALERGLEPRELAAYGRRHRRPFWEAAAVVFGEYLSVTALATPGGYDPAGIVDHAAGLLEREAELLNEWRARVRFVAVDDHHESGEALARLLDQLYVPGADLLLTGDPDATVEGFRGASPALLAEAPRRYQARNGSTAPVVVLGVAWRTPTAVRAVASRVVAGIGTLGPEPVARRQVLATRPPTGDSSPPHPSDPVTEPPTDQATAPVDVVADERPSAAPGLVPSADPERPGRADVAVLRSEASEAAYIAERLRRARLTAGTPWRQMAVIARSGAQTTRLRRALTQAGVPVAGASGTVPLRDEPAVRTLAAVVALAGLDPAQVDDPTSPAVDDTLRVLREIGGLDPLALNRLRRSLRTIEHRTGGSRPAAALLVAQLAGYAVGEAPCDAIDDPAEAGLRAARAVVAATRSAMTSGAGPDSVLWAAWNETGFAARWRQQALSGGRRGRRADRDLDAVTTLFAAAERFGERLPGAGIESFLDLILRQDLPEDSVADRAPETETVAVLTPQQALGREWDLVVVAGVQAGVWPNTRLRGSLLDAPGLVDVTAGRALTDDAGRRAAHTAVLHDELRMFYLAVTRARSELLVTAVSGAELVPSELLDLVAPRVSQDQTAVTVNPPRPMSLAGAVAQLRGQLQDALAAGDQVRVGRAAALLQTLARARVPGAAPDQWYRVGGLSDVSPLLGPTRKVRVSPSAIDTYQRCALRWVLTNRAGAQTPAPPVTALGTLVHDLAHTMPEAGEQELQAALDARWAEVGAPPGWLGEQLRGRAHDMLRRLAGYRAGAGEQLASEVSFETRLPGGDDEPTVVLTGIIDRVERVGEGAVRVIDYKTGKSKPAKHELARHAQLGVYQLAVENGALDSALPGPVSSAGAALVQLGSGVRAGVQEQEPLSRAADPDWARTLLRAAGNGMAAAVFPATANEGCRVCPVRSSCPLQPEGRHLA